MPDTISYVDTTWKTGQVITEASMKNINDALVATTQELNNAIQGQVTQNREHDTLSRRIDGMVKYFFDSDNINHDELQYTRFYASGDQETQNPIIVPTLDEYLTFTENFKRNFVEPYSKNKAYVAKQYIEYDANIYKVIAPIAKKTSAADDAAAWNIITSLDPSPIKQINILQELGSLINVYNNQNEITDEQNRIWIQNGGEETEVPTYEEFSSLKSAVVNLNCIDIIQPLEFYHASSRTTNGITFTWSDDNSACVISGTASKIARFSIFYNTSGLPSELEPGKIYDVVINNWPSGLTLVITDYSDGSAGSVLFDGGTSGTLEIPSETTGLLIQMNVAANTVMGNNPGTTVIAPKILTTKTNAYLAGVVDELNNELDNVIGELTTRVSNIETASNTNTISVGKLDKTILYDNSLDTLKYTTFMRGQSYTSPSGIRFDWNSEFTECTLTGTSSGISNYNIFANGTALPYGMNAGKTYDVLLDNWPTSVTLYIADYSGGTLGTIYFSGNKSGKVVISGGVTGLLVQIKVASGTDVGNGIVIKAPEILIAKTNKQLEQLVSDTINGTLLLAMGSVSSTYPDGIPGNTRRMYTSEKQYTDGYTLVEVDSGFTCWIYTYAQDGTYLAERELTGPSSFVINPNVYYRIGMAVDDGNGGHPVLTEDQKAQMIYHFRIYKSKGSMVEYQRMFFPEWTSASIFQTIGVIGDSWASGSLHHPDGSGWTGNYDLSWPQILARQIGATVTNFTIGGNDVKMWLNNATYGLPLLLSSPKQQLYIIDMGINDYNHINGSSAAHPLTLGTIDDIKSDYTQNPDTFYGCYGKIVGNILNYNPSAKIVLMSVPRKAERVMDAHIKAIAEKLSLPYINLMDDLFFNSQFFYEGIYNGHPLSYIYGGMASSIQRLLCKCIIDNTNYFGTYYGIDSIGTPDE